MTTLSPVWQKQTYCWSMFSISIEHVMIFVSLIYSTYIYLCFVLHLPQAKKHPPVLEFCLKQNKTLRHSASLRVLFFSFTTTRLQKGNQLEPAVERGLSHLFGLRPGHGPLDHFGSENHGADGPQEAPTCH